MTPILVASGGYSRGHLDFAKELGKHGIDSIFMIPEESKTSSVMEANNFDYFPVDVTFLPGLFSLSFERSVKQNFKKIVEEKKPDVILFEPLVAEIVMKIMKREKISSKTLMWDKSPPTDRTLLGRLQWRRWQNRWKRMPEGIDMVMCQSKPHVDFVKALNNNFNSDFTVMENGVDTNHFRIADETCKDPKKIVYCGTISKVRGVMKLKKTGDILEKMGVDFEMHFLGRGAEYNKLKRLEERHKWLHVHGFIEEREYLKHLSEAMIGVIPHPHYKCWEICSSLKLREYAAVSNVIVARDLEVHREFGNHGWMYLAKNEGDNDLALANAIKLAIEDDSAFERGRKAREFAEENFTYENQTKDLVAWLLTNGD